MEEVEDNGMDELQLVVFGLGEEEFGVDIAMVREIIKPVDITKMPRSPDFVEGIINLRNHATAIIDLRKRLDMAFDDRDENSRIIVIELENTVVGMIVDCVKEVLRLPVRDIDEESLQTSQIGAEYIRGVGKLEDGLLILLEINKLLQISEVAQMKEASAEAVA